MVDLTVTPANVLAGTNATKSQGTFGEVVTAGAAVYLDPTVKKWMLADNNSVNAAARQAIGIALNGGAVDQPVIVQTSGDIAIGAAITAGTAYYLSANPGKICPVADVVTGSSVCQLGIAKSTSVLGLSIQFPNVQL